MNFMLNLNNINKTEINIDENTIITLADFKHKKELTDLWLEAFGHLGDTEDFVKNFLDAYMIPAYNVPVVISGGKIVSAFYLIDFELYSNMKSMGMCAYLFAAATKKDFRSRGYMSKLIEYAAELCKNRGLKAIFLFPQEEKLFDFYSKFGFKSIYGTKKIKKYITNKDNMSQKNLNSANLSLQNQTITDVNVFDGLYKSYVDFTAKQDLSPLKDRLFYFKCASSYLDNPEHKFATFERKKSANICEENNVEKFCYVFYKIYKNTLYIDDIIIAEYEECNKIKENILKKFDETASLLADYIADLGCDMNFNQFEMNVLPSSFSDAGNFKTAMILPLSYDAEESARNLKSPVYLNMFMNI